MAARAVGSREKRSVLVRAKMTGRRKLVIFPSPGGRTRKPSFLEKGSLAYEAQTAEDFEGLKDHEIGAGQIVRYRLGNDHNCRMGTTGPTQGSRAK